MDREETHPMEMNFLIQMTLMGRCTWGGLEEVLWPLEMLLQVEMYGTCTRKKKLRRDARRDEGGFDMAKVDYAKAEGLDSEVKGSWEAGAIPPRPSANGGFPESPS